MLRAVGCDYVILGHSERRIGLGETDETVRRKVAAALAAGLTPIVCVGETLEQRERGWTERVVGAQVEAALSGLAGRLSEVVLAYEPVWAIGTGRTATAAQAQAVHAHLRERLAALGGRAAADAVRIQYGGSVSPSNAAELFGQVDVDGGLVGGASLDPDAFAAICVAAA
jgi:triosephosphate isomerase